MAADVVGTPRAGAWTNRPTPAGRPLGRFRSWPVRAHPLVRSCWCRTTGASGELVHAVAKITPQIVVEIDDGTVDVRVRPLGSHDVERLSETAYGFDLHPWVGRRPVGHMASLLTTVAPPGTPEWFAAALHATGSIEVSAELATVITWIEHPGLTASTMSPTRALADAMGWSERTLRRRLVDGLGVGPDRLRVLARVARARSRLIESEVSIAVAAAELGYADQSHLDRDFARFCGYTPSEWRSRRARWQLD